MYSLRSLAVVALSAATLVHGKANMVPNFEVKILMDPTVVLGSDHKLIPTVLSSFAMPTTVTKMNVQFLDTDNEDIYNAGWSPRMRKTEDEDDFELTYKKRYPISGDDIDAALTTANHEGFDISDDNYEAQVEWGYDKKTLSITVSKSGSDKGYDGMDLPGNKDARDMMVDKIPGKLEDWGSKNWGKNQLKNSRIYGPVLAKRSIGTWDGLKFYVEVWPIENAAGTGIEYLVEASFKTDSKSTASSKHDDLIEYLANKGWLLPGDSLKTQLIMERY